MSTLNQTRIAGRKTPDDWKQFRQKLLVGSDSAVWQDAFEHYFLERLPLRYLDPIKILREYSCYQGEGFAIVAIQCSLVEFLESTLQGLKYRFLRKGETLGRHEYSSSRAIFIKFLTSRRPFSTHFTEDSAGEFYVNIRCGLLHEASTKSGWTIWGRDHGARIIDAGKKIVYQDNLQDAFLEFIEAYKNDLAKDTGLQSAFIRKFDSLCE